MAQFKVSFKKSVEKDFKGTPQSDLQKILKKIQQLQNNPQPSDSEKLKGQVTFEKIGGRFMKLKTKPFDVAEHLLLRWPGSHASHGNLIEGSDQYYYVPGFWDSLVYFPAVAYF